MIAVLSFTSPLARAEEDFKDFAELDLEDLLNTTVISASRSEQKLYEAPNAMYVLTAEDIKSSGVVDLPDLFRMVPGVDVAGVYGNAYGVSARGFNDRFADRMLVMIDGRSIYVTFFGGVFWENEEIFLEDIKRIEIIRGPGGTMWGANAVNGVINIITKDPEEDQGLMITGRTGTKNYRENVTRYSDTIGKNFSYRITGGYREDEGTRSVHDYRRVPKGTGRFKYKLTEDTNLHFFAGVNESQVGLDLTTYTNSSNTNVRSNHQMLRLEHTFSETSQLQFQGYYSEAIGNSKDKSLEIEEQKSGIDFQHSFPLGSRNQIVWGANYKNTSIDSNLLKPGDEAKGLMPLFDDFEATVKIKKIIIKELKEITTKDLKNCAPDCQTPELAKYHLALIYNQEFEDNDIISIVHFEYL